MTLTVGTLSGVLELDANPFDKALDRSMRSGAQRATDMGDKMTKRVTLPLVAAGGAALKMGIDFETSMSRMVGLVGLSTDEVAELRGGIMDLSGETAKAPQELADAMFTVTSAGFRGAEAMDVLTSAAKASAAGLGETRTIAEALTGAVNAYGPEVLDAARATDVLVATARAGNFESSQLAGVLGKITPFAKQAGASLEDVGGSIALLTRVNNNATESGTQVAAMLRAFVVPTEEAKKELDKLYGSTQAFRDIIKRDGLVAALQDLDKRLGGNREQLGKILGSSEAASAAFQILEADADTLAGTFGTVADSAGMTDEAFDAAAETSGFKLQQALAKLQAALIEVGDTIAPFVATVAGGLSTVADAFAALPGPVQNVLILFASVMAAVGPLMSVGGRIAQNWSKMGQAFDRAATGAYSAAGGVGKLGKALGALAIAAVVYQLYQLAQAAGDVEVNVEKAARATTDQLVEGFRMIDEWAGRSDAMDAFQQMAEGSIATARRLRDALVAAGEDAAEFDRILADVATGERQAAADADAAAGAVDELGGEIDGAGSAAAGAVGGIDDFADANADAVDPVQELEDAIKAVTDAVRAQMDPWFAAQDALLGHQEAQEAVTEAEWAVVAAMTERDKAIKEHGKGSDEARQASEDLWDAERDLERKQRDVIRSAMDVTTATHELARKMDEGVVSIAGAEAQLRTWVAQGLLTEEQAAAAAEKLGLVGWQAAQLEGKRVDIPVSANTSAWERSIAAIYQRDYPAIRISTAGGGGIPLRHSGGRGAADEPLLVGNYGHEELFVPDSAGTIFSNTDTNRFLGGGRDEGSGGSGTLVADLTVKLDGRKIGSSRSVIEGIDSTKAKRSRRTGGRG